MHPISSKAYYGACKTVGDVKTKTKQNKTKTTTTTKKTRSKRQTRECILVLNKTRGNAIAHYNESVFYKSHGVGHAVESEKQRTLGMERQAKIETYFFFQNFYLRSIWSPGIFRFLLR